MSRRTAAAACALGLVCLVLWAGPALAEELAPLAQTQIQSDAEGVGPATTYEHVGNASVPERAVRVHVAADWNGTETGRADERVFKLCERDCEEDERVFAKTRATPPLNWTVDLVETDRLGWKAGSTSQTDRTTEITGTLTFLGPAPPDPAGPPSPEGTSPAAPSDSGAGLGTLLALGSVSLATTATLAVARAAGSPKRWLPAGLVGLYHRIRDDELLGHPLRAAIYDRVREEPGIHFRELLRDLDAGRGNLQRHLDRLVDADLLSVHRGGGYRCYVVTGTVDPGVVEAAPVLRTDTARRVFQAVRREPGATLTALADRTELSTSTVGYHLDNLEDAGLVEREQDGNGLDVEVTDLGRQAADELAVA